jgi:aryl-alcohol dehydrogenase-like predicted oxidoreductase
MLNQPALTRTLGRSGIEVSALGMGCWAIGGPWDFLGGPAGWGASDDAESIRALHAAFDHGITFYDTAANYGTGHSEKLVGQAFADRRDRVVIATKFGYAVDEAGKAVTEYPDRGDVAARLPADCDASLRRLNTDVIDLYQFHVNAFPPEEADAVVAVLEDLVAVGKTRAYGWSTDNPDGARVFAQGEHCTAIQNNMNVIQDAPDILAVCAAFNLASINRGPLAMGLLTGKYTAGKTLPEDDVRGPNAPDWMKYFKDGQANPEWLVKANAIGEILRSEGRTLAQGALAWLWARSPRTLPIPGFRTTAQIEENCGALVHGPLTQAQMQEIDGILGRSTVTS